MSEANLITLCLDSRDRVAWAFCCIGPLVSNHYVITQLLSRRSPTVEFTAILDLPSFIHGEPPTHAVLTCTRTAFRLSADRHGSA
jgi:hypothetical protein